MYILDVIRDGLGIVLSIVLSVVAILSYRQAKKTLFQPITTEVFKLRLNALEDIISYFRIRNDFQFVNELDLKRVVDLNAQIMLSEYTVTQFPGHPYIDIESVVLSQFETIIVPADHLHKTNPQYFESVSNSKNDETIERQPPWSQYDFYSIGYTKKYASTLDVLVKLANPLLVPKEICNNIDKLRDIISDNLEVIRKIIQKDAEKMPDVYRHYCDIEIFSSQWIYEDVLNARTTLDAQLSVIMNSVAKYLRGVDKLGIIKS